MRSLADRSNKTQLKVQRLSEKLTKIQPSNRTTTDDLPKRDKINNLATIKLNKAIDYNQKDSAKIQIPGKNGRSSKVEIPYKNTEP